MTRTEKRNVGVEVKYQANVNKGDTYRIVPIKDYLLLSREDVGGRGNVLMVPVDIFLSLLPPSERNI